MNLSRYFKTFFICFIGFSLLGTLTFAQGPKWINYSSDFLFHDIDFEGNYVWISTEGGLVRYDKISGTSTHFLASNSEIKNNNVLSVLVASNGDKWICTNAGGLQHLNGSTWTNYFITAQGDSLCHSYKADEDPSGNIWISSAPKQAVGNALGSQLFKFNGSQFTKISLPIGVQPTRDIACDQSGNIWVAFQNGLQKYDGVNWTSYDTINSNIPGIPFRILIDNNNHLWATVSTAAGNFLSEFDGTVFTNYQMTFNIGTQTKITLNPNNNILICGGLGLGEFDGTTFTQIFTPPFPGEGVAVAARDSGGNIYAGFSTVSDTLFFNYNPATNQWTGIQTKVSGLETNYGRELIIDGHNNRWIIDNATHQGIYKFNGTTWTDYNPSNSGIPSAYPYCVFSDHNNNIWVGFFNAGTSAPLAMFDGSTWQYYYLPTLFPTGNGQVMDISEDSNGALWIAAYGGIAKYYLGNWTYFLSANLPTTANYIFKIESDLNDNLWAATLYEGLYKYDGTTWTLFNTSTSGLLNNQIADITIDSNNSLWVSTEDSLIQKFDGATWTTYPANITGITYPVAFGIEFNEIDNTLWLTSLFEVVKYDGGIWHRYDLLNSGISNGAYQVYIDDYNNKWFSTTNSGISVYNESGINFEHIMNFHDKKIKGNVFFDTNSNGQFDAPNDHGVSARKVKILPSGGITYTNSQGNYTFNVDSGFYEVGYSPDSNWVITSDSAIYHVSVDSTGCDSLDFGTLFSGIENQALITTVALSNRCSLPGNHIITFRNEGTTVLDGEIRYVFDPALTFLSSTPPPLTIIGDTLVWNYTNLLQFEERQYYVVLQNPGVQPPGILLSSYATIDHSGTTLSSDTTYQDIICSYDPNDKQVHPIGVGVNHEILPGDSLTYTIRFQNTGSDTAYFVMVVDTLSSYLDMNTFEFLSSSHDVQINCGMNGVVTFVYDDINLLWSDFNEPESHGYVKFRIKPKNGLALPVEITNEALIFFDFNPYIITNTVTNNLVTTYTGLIDYSVAPEKLLVYPNPSSGDFTVQFSENNTGGNCSIYNATGKLIQSWLINPGQRYTHISGISSGLFLVNYHSNDGSTIIQKIISQ